MDQAKSQEFEIEKRQILPREVFVFCNYISTNELLFLFQGISDLVLVSTLLYDLPRDLYRPIKKIF